MHNLPCSFDCSQKEAKLKQKCPNHPKNMLTHFCSNCSCLELLCSECLKHHQAAHKTDNISDENIRSLIQIENYYETSCKIELDYQRQRKQRNLQKNNRLDPCQIICQLIDEHFYGSTENKIQNLKQRKKVLSNPSASQFIDTVQKSANYKVKQNFKEKYFAFLDELFEVKK